MSKKFARCSLYVLSMACLTVQAAEPLTSLDKPEGRLPGRGISNAARLTSSTTGSPSLKKRPGVRLMSKPPLPLTRWSA